MAITTPPAPSGTRRPPRIPAGTAALAAVLAVAAALGVGELVAALVSPASSPFLAVGQTAIRLTPEWLKEFAIANFGVYDKVALLSGMAVVIALIAVAAGVASRQDDRPGLVVVAVMGVLGLLAVLSAPTFAPLDLVAPFAALLAGIGAWTAMHRAATALADADADADAVAEDADDDEVWSAVAPARRRVLLTMGGVAAAAGLAGLAGRLLATGGGSPSSIGPLPTAAGPPPAPVVGADYAALGTPTWLTSAADFYRIDTALSVPRLSTATWSLRIHGMVDRELTLSWDQLRSRRLIEAPVTLTCVSNEVGGNLISNGRWLGVPIADLLAEVGVQPGAEQIASTSSDGWNANTPLGPLTDGRPAMLAIGLNGEPLPVEHGFPVRMVVPGLYGYVSACKWITDIEVTTFAAFTSYWELRGWGQQGPVKTESRIDVPRADATVPAGPTTLAGVAWAQHTGIDGVEVRVDGGAWQPAELAAEPTTDAWRMWKLATTLAPGPHQLQVRATDRSGYTQTEQVVPSIPDGATGWHTVAVTAV